MTYQYANYHGYSDIYPYEIIGKVSDKTMVVRGMDAIKDPTWKPNFVAGGFAGHCTNQNTQRWIIKSCEANSEFRIRLHKDGVWRDKSGAEFYLSEKPRAFYDYNF